MKADVVRHLTQTGYVPLRAQDRAVLAAARRSLGVLGDASKRALLFHMCLMTGQKERELLSNYREFERALWSILGNGADILLKRFCDNLSRNIGSDGLGVTQVLDAIKRDEPYVLVRNIDFGENVLLLYRSENFRDRIMSGFFSPLDDDSAGAGAAALAASHSLPANVNTMTYERLVDTYAGRTIEEKTSSWLSSIARHGRPLRLARDNTWLAEKRIDERPHQKDAGAAVLCAYDAGRLSQESAVRIMELHDIIVFEESQSVYARN
ncbi:MAG: hypothetical protein ABI347_09925 [Nitrososphaera sp.]